MRHCNKCNITQRKSDFYRGQRCCKSCTKVYKKAWKEKNKGRERVYLKEWRRKTAQNPNWNLEKRTALLNENYHSEYINSYVKNRRRSDVGYRILLNLRNRICTIARNWRVIKSDRTISLTGCDVSFLINHLEKQFTSEMKWGNYGSLWEIDHIIPCSFFNLKVELNQRVCFNYMNLSPLDKIKNRSKRDSVLNPEHLQVILNHLNISIDEFEAANSTERREAEAV